VGAGPQDRHANVADDITLTNITQITNRSHTSLTDIGTNTHAALDTFKDTTYPAHTGNADAHHAESHALASHSDVTVTGAYLEDHLLYGSGNAAYVPCIPVYADNCTLSQGDGTIYPSATGTVYMYWWLPLPCIRSGLKLYVTHALLGIYDADAGDKVTELKVKASTAAAPNTDLYTDATARDSPGEYEYDFGGADDCSGYDRVMVRLQLSVTTPADIEVVFVNIKCYYGA
jgi:hypothetical protein